LHLQRGDVVSVYSLPVVTITLRALHDEDLDDLFRWESDPRAASMAAFTRADPADRAAFDAHYERVRSEPDNTNLAIEEDGVLAGMIASFTVEGERELTYWIDPLRWGRGVASGAVQIFLRLETRRPLFGRAAAHNLGSSKVLLRNGFIKIGDETSSADGVGEDVLEHIYRLDYDRRPAGPRPTRTCAPRA
jgi:RimJ/RimL family protein N-acetyltransferase